MEMDSLDQPGSGQDRTPDQIARGMSGWQPEDAKATKFVLNAAAGGARVRFPFFL
jgi:hypothetical protein